MVAAVPDPEFRLLDGSFFPPESAYHNAASTELYNMNNIEKSKEYLKQAGYNGEPITYQVIGTNETQVRTGTAVVGQLKSRDERRGFDIRFADVGSKTEGWQRSHDV